VIDCRKKGVEQPSLVTNIGALCYGGKSSEQLQTQAETKKDLHRFWNIYNMCLDACDGNKTNAIIYFRQVYFVGCVRAGITRLEKNLVGVFDLR
jgi:hypothetical protein